MFSRMESSQSASSGMNARVPRGGTRQTHTHVNYVIHDSNIYSVSERLRNAMNRKNVFKAGKKTKKVTLDPILVALEVMISTRCLHY